MDLFIDKWMELTLFILFIIKRKRKQELFLACLESDRLF